MTKTILNKSNCISRQLIVSSLLLGLLSVSGCKSSTNAPSATSQIAANNNSATDKWSGQWQVIDPSSGQTLKFVLTPEGKLFVLPPASSSASPIAYEVPIQKISEAPTLPPNTKIVQLQEEFKNQANKARQSEAKQYIGSMNRSQQAYYLENSKFATTIEDLQVGIKPETEDYIYKIVPQADLSHVMMTAQAKNSKLKSYTGAVFVTSNTTGEKITRAGVCETDEPSSTPPAMPTPPSDASGQIQCPVGSSPL